MTNTLLLGPAGMLVTNNLLPITVSLFGLYFFIRGMDEYRRRPWLFFLSGLCISVAIGLKRSEEHTSELQSLMRISYAVFCLTKKTNNKLSINHYTSCYSHVNE